MSLKSWLDTLPETMLSRCFINTQGAAAQQTRRTCISHTTCFKFFILTCMTTHTRPCSRTHIHTTFCSTDGFKVESQLFDTHPADLIVLHLSCTTQAHWLHIWDLEFTNQGLWSHIKKNNKKLLSFTFIIRPPPLTWAPTSCSRAQLTGSRSMSVLMGVWSKGQALRCSLRRQVLHTVWEQPRLMGWWLLLSNSL